MNSHVKDLVELRNAALKKVVHYEEQAKLIQNQIDEIGGELGGYAKLSDLISRTHRLAAIDVYTAGGTARYRVRGWVKVGDELIVNAQQASGGDEITLRLNDEGVVANGATAHTTEAMFSTSWLQPYAKRRVELILSDRYES